MAGEGGDATARSDSHELREQPGVHRRIAGDDRAMLDGSRFAVQVSDDAAGFADQEDARRDVPRRETQLPERFVATARDVSEIEGRRARATKASGSLHQTRENAHVRLDPLAV